MTNADLFFIIRWWLLFLLIGLSFFPLSSFIFSKFLDRGYIFSKIIGVLLISYTIFVISSIHLLKFSVFSLVLVWMIFLIFNIFILLKKRGIKNVNFKLILFEEVIFLICLIAWSFVRSFQPSLQDLEKFMDFGFLNSVLRTDYFPAKDMWLTPLSINYYYFGHLFTGVLTKLSFMPSYITFNLMISSIFAFTFSGAFSIGLNMINQINKLSLKKKTVFGLLFGFIVSLSGNIETVYAFFKTYPGEMHIPFWKLTFALSSFPNSYWYPTATRFIYRTIHEFPSYSFVVADLHGHVLNIPVVLLSIALLLHIFLKKEANKLDLVLLPFLLAISYMTNAWDGIIYLGLSLFVIFFLNYSKPKKLTEAFIRTIKQLLIILPSFFIFTFMFNRSFSPFASGIGLNCAPDFLLKLGKLGPFLFEKNQCQHTPFWQFFILYGFFFYFIFSFFIFLRKREMIKTDLFVLISILFSLLLIITPEIFYLRDIYTGYFRANTMFKLSYQAFIIFSFSSIYILIRIISAYREVFISKVSKMFLGTFLLGSAAMLFFVTIYCFFSIPSAYNGLTKSQGLNGILYLKTKMPGDFLSINWINKNIKGQPVILEAQGDSYTDYARISANTGLPTILGWTVHEWLWRGSYQVPSARFDDIKNLYETNNEKVARKIIKKYNVSYVYIGDLERTKYKVSQEKFKKLGSLVYSNSGVYIFKIH